MNRTAFAAIAVGIALTIGAEVSLAQTKTSKLAVEDHSLPGSPFAISGSVSIHETIRPDNTLSVSASDHVVARNISSKTVMVAVFRLDVKPALTGPQTDTRQYECFFAEDVIRPGEEHDISQPEGSASVTIEPFRPGRSEEPPAAEIRTLFVQFTDGSIYGDQTHARHILSLRRQTWQALKHLEATYAHRGEAAFLAQLLERVEPGEVDTFLESMRQTQRQFGTAAAVARIREALRLAEEHQAAFKEKDKA